jgi:hypothetical protein
MAVTAAYDEIADWYEEEFLARQGPPGEDPLGIDDALRELLGEGRGTCLEVGCGTPAAACPSAGRTPDGCHSGTAASRRSSR